MERKNLVGGIIVILIGVLMLLATMGITKEVNILLLIGAGFIAAYIFSKRQLGFLIPGCIVFSIGLFTFLTDNYIISQSDGELFLVLLGCAFLAVMLIHTMWIKVDNWGAKYWPIIPGGVLIIIGIFAYLDKSTGLSFMETIFRYGWPVIIILVGLRLLIWPPHKHNRGEDRTGNNGNSNM